MILSSAYYAGYSISALAVQEAQKAKHRPYYQLYRQQHSEQAWPCTVSFYFEDFRETWTRKFHHRDFCFLKSPWCVGNPAYLPIKSRERPQIAIIWLFDRCISLNSTYSKMIYYEIGSKRSLRIRKAKWQRRTNYFFFIRTSNFDAEAERSYIFWRFEAETFLKMFLNLQS